MVGSFIKKAALGVSALIIVAAGSGLTLAYSPTAHAAEAQECVVTDKLVNTCRPWLGAAANGYPGISGTGSQIMAHEQRIGRQLDIVHLYTSPGQMQLSDESVLFATRPNTILSVTWQPASKWADANGANPTTNANIDAMADSIKALGTSKIMLTLHHEPENDVSGGGEGCAANKTWVGNTGTPAQYRQMWHTVRERFDAKGVTNVVWVMNYMGYSGWDCIVDDLYPGNEFVDWVKWDPYGEKVNFEDLASRFYDYLARTSDAEHDYLSKSWGLAEWGSWHNATQDHAYLLNQTAKTAVETNRFPRLKAYSVFDVSGTCRILYDRNGNQDPTELAYYKAFANSPVFSDTATPPPGPEPDTTAPSAPTNLAGAAGIKQITLSWTASTDNVGVAGYYVLRDGVRIATLDATKTSYTATGLTSGKTYWFKVRAFDAADNKSDTATVAVKAL